MKLMNDKERKAYIEATYDEKNRDYAKTFDYIAVGDGNIIRVKRPGIMRDIWYDDETPHPFGPDGSRKHEAFIAHNMANFDDMGVARWMEAREQLRTRGCCTGAFITRPRLEKPSWDSGWLYATLALFDGYPYHEPAPVGELDDAQMDELAAIMEELRGRYLKRLESYWKRYGDKVYARGYWAMR